MATAKTGKRTSSGSAGKKTSSKLSGNAKTSARESSSKTDSSRTSNKRPIRREVWCVVCIFLAFLGFLAFFGVNALVIDIIRSFALGMLGKGASLLPFMLLIVSGILATHGGRPVRMRIFCCIGISVLFGALCQVFVTVPENVKLITELYNAKSGGGVIAGLIGIGLKTMFSKVGAAIMLIVLILLFIFLSFSRRILAFIQYLRQREPPKYEVRPEPERIPRRTKDVQTATDTEIPKEEYKPGPRRKIVDIPIGDSHELQREQREPVQMRSKHKSFFKARDKSIRTPDEVIAMQREAEAAIRRAEEKARAEEAERAKNAAAQVKSVDIVADEFALAENEAENTVGEVVEILDVENGWLDFENVSSTKSEALDRPENSKVLSPYADTIEIVQYARSETVPESDPIDDITESAPDTDIDTMPSGLKVDISTGEIVDADDDELYNADEIPDVIYQRTQQETASMPEPMVYTPSLEAVAETAGKLSEEGYIYPGIDLLNEPKIGAGTDISGELKANAQRLAATIKSFGIDARIINVTRGPSVTRYELELEMGVKLTRLTGLSDDIALSLGASGVRVAPIPDKISVVGIEVPNKTVDTVYLRELVGSKEFQSSKSQVTFAVGRGIGGELVIGDIAKLPHMLIAGTTGSGKSVCMNTLIISLLYKASPDEVRFIMIDPKMIELNTYNGIPHLLIPVVTDPKKAAGALQWAVSEMMHRYKLFSEHNVRDFSDYNDYAMRSGGDIEKIPRIVVLIDELADLMLVAAKEVEEAICRLAQMARAAGMHLVIATQSPRADVITGIMKANIPSRIAFAVASQLESRIIMETSGAEKLVGKGDMLFSPQGSGKPKRVQGCYVDSDEIDRVITFVKNSGRAEYSEDILTQIEKNANSGKGQDSADPGANDLDEMFVQAVDVILEVGQASTSMLQRRLKLGYARAARLVDQLEQRGILGPFEGSKPRQILITKNDWEEMKMSNPDYN